MASTYEYSVFLHFLGKFCNFNLTFHFSGITVVTGFFWTNSVTVSNNVLIAITEIRPSGRVVTDLICNLYNMCHILSDFSPYAVNFSFPKSSFLEDVQNRDDLLVVPFNSWCVKQIDHFQLPEASLSPLTGLTDTLLLRHGVLIKGKRVYWQEASLHPSSSLTGETWIGCLYLIFLMIFSDIKMANCCLSDQNLRFDFSQSKKLSHIFQHRLCIAYQ